MTQPIMGNKASKINNSNSNDNAAISKLDKMPYKEELLKHDVYFKEIASQSQSSLFGKMASTLINNQNDDRYYNQMGEDTKLQLKMLKALLHFVDPLLIESQHQVINDNQYNIVELCQLMLPNQYNESKQFLSDLKTLHKNALHSFLMNNKYLLLKQLNIMDDITWIVCEYTSAISKIFEHNYSEKDGYPRSFHHGPYFCHIKSIFISMDFISIEFDEHGDANDAGPIQPPIYSRIKSDGGLINKTADYESEFEYDLNKRCRGRLIYKFRFNQHKDEWLDDMKQLAFKYGSGGYSKDFG